MTNPPSPPRCDPDTPLAEQLSATLRGEILRGRFRSGERLPSERELALRFGVHRGAAREALKNLEQLGLAEIKPGGARVRPLEQASLAVLEHLLDLDDSPESELLDQLHEALCGLFALAARLGVERADADQHRRASQILAALTQTSRDEEAQQARLFELGELFIEASGNRVLGLVHRGLETSRITPRLQQLPQRAGDESTAPSREILLALQGAVAQRNGAAASEAIHQFADELRRNAAARRESAS